MRAARQAAELGFEIEAATVELARAEAGRAGEPAGERQLAELRLLLAGPDPLRGLRLLDELGATAGVLPELEALKGVRQNPNHHLDVHGHTIEVLERWLAIEDDLDTYAGESAERVAALLAEPLADGWTRRDALRLGAITHDVGKPATRAETPTWVTFIGHDSEGARILAGTFEAAQGQPRAFPLRAGTGRAPPPPRLPRPRTAALPRAPLRVPSGHGAGRGRRDAADDRRPARRPRRRARRPPTR